MTPQRRPHRLAALLLAVALAPQAHAADDTTFLSGPELGQRLLRNVVRVRSLDIGEHGFGLVVAVQPRHVLIATARHVVLPRAGTELVGFDESKRRIDISFCSGDAGTGTGATGGDNARAAELERGFNANGHDLALLRVLRPAGYDPLRRATATEASVERRQEVWLMGQEQLCGVSPRSGAVAATSNAQQNLRVEFPGVRGGASGGPAFSGHGLIGLVTQADDLTFTVHSIASLEARVRAHASDAWALEAARNIPPSDPHAAEVDLSETLNQYLFNARNLQELLLQPMVPRPRFVAFANDYNAVVMNRFAVARERHDGALRRHWPEPVFAQWQALRDQLWHVHQSFRALNAGEAKAIFDDQHAPPAVLDRMRALDPELTQLQAGIAQFLQALGQRSKS